LELFEDNALELPNTGRAQWLNSWHSELDWFRAIHKTRYSNAMLALHEQFLRAEPPQAADYNGLLLRFSARKRQLAEPDFIVFANDHWNFNVRGFNPGYRDAAIDDLAAPDLFDVDLLVVLGGPIGAYEGELYPFLIAELNLIERRLGAGKPVLGICLGSQLMASALGSRVYPGTGKEIGWAPITLTEAGRASRPHRLTGS
jgi:hypothetical protein